MKKRNEIMKKKFECRGWYHGPMLDIKESRQNYHV